MQYKFSAPDVSLANTAALLPVIQQLCWPVYHRALSLCCIKVDCFAR